jgi:hypothetical protein
MKKQDHHQSQNSDPTKMKEITSVLVCNSLFQYDIHKFMDQVREVMQFFAKRKQ